ncbi:phage antirepressor KilAC domain-containing protein, partial [Acinetobacter baumannii]
ALSIPQNLPDALRLAADLADQKAKAEAALAIAAPKAEALDRLASQADGAVCLRIAAKLLQVPEKKFLQFAHAEGFIFRHHHSRVWQ